MERVKRPIMSGERICLLLLFSSDLLKREKVPSHYRDSGSLSILNLVCPEIPNLNTLRYANSGRLFTSPTGRRSVVQVQGLDGTEEHFESGKSQSKTKNTCI